MKAALVVLLFSCVALAAGTPDPLVPLIAPPPGLEWLTPQIVEELIALPGVGPYLVIGLQYVGFIAAAFTALSLFVGAILQGARAFAWAVGLEPVADALHRVHQRLWPYLAYLSIFNVPRSAPRVQSGLTIQKEKHS